MINEYDEIKNLIRRSKMLFEQSAQINLAKSIEDEIEDDQDMNDDEVDKIKKDKS